MSSLNGFIERVASDSPTPGGGSVSALASSLGCALAEMVSGISIGKEKNENVKEAMRSALDRSTKLRRRLIHLIEKDAQAYQAVLDSLSLPKGTSEEKERRKKAVQEALIEAAKPPIDIVRISLEVLRIASDLAEIGSKSACTDVGVAALMAHAGLYGGYLNVRVNLASVKDEDFKKKMEDEARSALDKGHALLQSTLAIVDSKLSFQ
ncbi:MAG: cyclodeaminase/cyclohydrolase family protein [Thermoplasmata archaeon]